MAPRILIADDELPICEMLVEVLTAEGYEVEVAHSGDALIRKAQEHVPDLLLVDVMMPHLDGYEAIRQLRNDTRTSHLPMLILTARTGVDDVVTGFETGADDFITKPFKVPELLARVKSQLKRATRLPVHSPLTGLPGNMLIAEEVRHRLAQGQSFALIYIDIDHFKSFNDTYGFARGDQVIRLVAQLLQAIAESFGDPSIFIGHIGGDDFTVILHPDRVETFCRNLIEQFDCRIPDFYDPDDVQRGYLRGVDRNGVPRRFPVMTISMGVATTLKREFDDFINVTRVATEMKHFAKQVPGSTFTIDERSATTSAVPFERRGQKARVVLLLGPDAALRRLLAVVLENDGYEVLQASRLADVDEPTLARADLVALEAREESTLTDVVKQLRQLRPGIPVVLMSTRVEDEEPGFAAGINAFLQQPFGVQQFTACVSQILRRDA